MQSISAVGSTAYSTFGVTSTSAVDTSSIGNPGWQKLTADDWNIMSAMTGTDVRAQLADLKPGEVPLLPLMAADLLSARNSGSVPNGQNFSPQFFKGRLDAAGDLMGPDERQQLEGAYAYTIRRDATYIDSRAGRLNVYG
jgi:hypothetical protein